MVRTLSRFRTNTAIGIAFIAGFCLIIAGVNGVSAWVTVKNFVTLYIIDNTAVRILFACIIFIASLGGIAVILGGLFIGGDKLRIGKLFISLGAGLGLLGFTFLVIVAIIGQNFDSRYFLSFGGVGLFLSIIARSILTRE
jgi:hypothetical protein